MGGSLYFTGEITIQDIVELLKAAAALLWPLAIIIVVLRLA